MTVGMFTYEVGQAGAGAGLQEVMLVGNNWLPRNPKTSDERNTFVNDSHHRAVSMDPTGNKLCIAKTKR
ncbi:hypothetical protein [Nocardia salmonicida]|uniref:hypothetical protein n=1 Tax=Nocardia salmonicida TaxID=53431 RepID=UPI0007A4DDA3|nr:hypothetical protein [Nocardia salmonicida]